MKTRTKITAIILILAAIVVLLFAKINNIENKVKEDIYNSEVIQEAIEVQVDKEIAAMLEDYELYIVE